MNSFIEKTKLRGSPLERLLESIESGELPPGTRLLETEIAERFGISRTPVREALHRLHAMGLAEHGPQRGLIVSYLGYDQLRQLFAVREGLEGMAARLAAEYATRAEVNLLQEMVETDRGINDPKELLARNKMLHQQIARASHNVYMIDALQNLRLHLSLLPGSTYNFEERRQQAQEEHEEVVSAIVRGDGDAAESAARKHIASGFRLRLGMMSSQEAG